ncbi:MAG: hypothetical protein WBL25_07105 [Anaerolineales bacterium]
MAIHNFYIARECVASARQGHPFYRNQFNDKKTPSNQVRRTLHFSQTPQLPQFPPAHELHPPLPLSMPLTAEPPLWAKASDSLRFTFSPPQPSHSLG